MSWFIAEVVLQAKLKFSVIKGKTLTGTRERLFFFSFMDVRLVHSNLEAGCCCTWTYQHIKRVFEASGCVSFFSSRLINGSDSSWARLIREPRSSLFTCSSMKNLAALDGSLQAASCTVVRLGDHQQNHVFTVSQRFHRDTFNAFSCSLCINLY